VAISAETLIKNYYTGGFFSMKKTALYGREVEISEIELIKALHYYNDHVESLTEDKWLEVIPEEIDTVQFLEARVEPEEESLRKLIWAAVDEAQAKPEYLKPFYTKVPSKPEKKSVNKIIDEAICDELQIANWIQVALEWAYRITLGESWQKICSDSDSSSYYKLVFWNDGLIHTIGGAKKVPANLPEVTVFPSIMDYDFVPENAVPKYVRYKK